MSDRLPSILLTHDFFNKARNRKWIVDNGSEAVIVLQVVWLASSQERNCKIKKEEALFLPYPVSISIEKIQLLLDSAIAVGLLEEDSHYYFNSQIVNDHKQFQVKRENYRKGRQKREGIYPESSEDSPRILEQTYENHIEPEYEYEPDIESNKKSTTKISFDQSVRLTKPEYDSLIIAKGENYVKELIEFFGQKKRARKLVYDSDLDAIKLWGLKAFEEHKSRNAKPTKSEQRSRAVDAVKNLEILEIEGSL